VESPGVGSTWSRRKTLYVVPPAPGESRRIPWEQVERADWQKDSERLVVAEVGTKKGDRLLIGFAAETDNMIDEARRNPCQQESFGQ